MEKEEQIQASIHDQIARHIGHLQIDLISAQVRCSKMQHTAQEIQEDRSEPSKRAKK